MKEGMNLVTHFTDPAGDVALDSVSYQIPDNPIYMLMNAIFQDALGQIGKVDKQSGVPTTTAREALQWFLDKTDSAHIYTCANICEAFGLSHRIVRDGVLRRYGENPARFTRKRRQNHARHTTLSMTPKIRKKAA